MVEDSGQPRLMAEAAQHLFFIKAVHVQTHGLERHGAADVRIAGAIDHTHRSPAQLTFNHISADLLRRLLGPFCLHPCVPRLP